MPLFCSSTDVVPVSEEKSLKLYPRYDFHAVDLATISCCDGFYVLWPKRKNPPKFRLNVMLIFLFLFRNLIRKNRTKGIGNLYLKRLVYLCKIMYFPLWLFLHVIKHATFVVAIFSIAYTFLFAYVHWMLFRIPKKTNFPIGS